MFLQKAMRYYRLWIYTCNAVLFAAVVVLVVVATHTATHPYFPLLPGPPAYDPTYLYAYLALFLQAGVVQVLGCLGAIRLSQKLLHIYWLTLATLLLGDIVIGLVWFLRFPKLTIQINPSMNASFHEYGYKESSTNAWDTLQSAEQCCGIRSPDDYSTNRWGIQERVVPTSCCVLQGARAVQSDQAARHVPLHHTDLRSEKTFRNKSYACPRNDQRLNRRGCEEALRNWMHSSAEALMILGFCVITFIKLCFVGILRFEIQEMIEKIKVLQGESSNTPNAELAAALGLVLPCPQANSDLLGDEPETESEERGRGIENNDNVTQDKEEQYNAERHSQTNLPGNGSASIGIREERPKRSDTLDSSMSPLAMMRANLLLGTAPDPGGDSDTNSHSALITDTPVHRPFLQDKHFVPDKNRHNGNNNDINPSLATVTTTSEIHGLYHVRQTQI